MRYFDKARHQAKELACDVYLVSRQWVRLAWYLGCCLLMTGRLLVRVIVWVGRMLTPIPTPVGPANRDGRRPTGLRVPTFDLLVIVFGTAALVGYVW